MKPIVFWLGFLFFSMSATFGELFIEHNTTKSDICYIRENNHSPTNYLQTMRKISCTRTSCPGSAYDEIKRLIGPILRRKVYDKDSLFAHREHILTEGVHTESEMLGTNTDGDYCCPAVKFTWEGDTLTNEKGERILVTVDDQKQSVEMARCPELGRFGRCRPATTTSALLVWADVEGNGNPIHTFESFNIETYCICEGN